MNPKTARKIATRVAKLTERATIFNIRYGQDYHLKPGSPPEAWALYDEINQLQVEIARLLSEHALEKPFCRWGRWWESHEVINAGILNELAAESFRLIGYCAGQKAIPDNTTMPRSIDMSQETIAGMLHPSARQLGLDYLSSTGRSA